jgi:hypothetical protein
VQLQEELKYRGFGLVLLTWMPGATHNRRRFEKRHVAVPDDHDEILHGP